ncbi:MAG: thioredoxin family protein [Propionivibrio sp.]
MSFLGKKKEPEEKPALLEQAMLDQLRTHFQKIQHPVELVASLDEKPKSGEMRAFLEEISLLSDKIKVAYESVADARMPSFSVARQGENARIRFAGLPLGHELTSLVLAILHCSGHPPKEEPALIDQIRSIEGDCSFETYITLSCHNCPDAVQAFNLMAAVNPRIRHTMIDGKLFMDEIDRHKIDAVPAILLNGQPFARGRKPLKEFVDLVASASR